MPGFKKLHVCACGRSLWQSLVEIEIDDKGQAIGAELTRLYKCGGCGAQIEVLADGTIHPVAVFDAKRPGAVAQPVGAPVANHTMGVRSAATAQDRKIDPLNGRRRL